MDEARKDPCCFFNPRKQIPEWDEITAEEIESRNDAMLGFEDDICGLKVRPLTFRHILWLDIYSSPFLLSLEPKQLLGLTDQFGNKNIHLHVARFMWVLSPSWKPFSKLRQKLFFWKYRHKLYKQKNNTMEIVNQIFKFMDASCYDLKSNSREQKKSVYSAAAGLVHALCSNYSSLSPFPNVPNSALDLPLKIAGQLIRAQIRSEDPKADLPNRTDGLLNNWLEEQNRQLKRN